MIFSPDTNFFLQCRDASDLPWRDLGQQEIVLIVSRTVLKEIDGLKQDGNGRRAKRARAATARFRAIIKSSNGEVMLSDGEPRVVMRLAPPLAPGRSWPASLDPSIADDRIIEETLALGDLLGEIPRLLTHDTNAILTARAAGLAEHLVPDHWLLGPEPDERDKKLAKLTERVQALETQAPVVNLRMLDNTGAAKDRVELTWRRYPALSADATDAIVGEAVLAHPMATEFPTAPPKSATSLAALGMSFNELLGRWEPPSASEIAQYRDQAYPKWKEDLRRWLQRLPGLLCAREERQEVLLEIANTGHRPAENLVLEIEARGPLVMLPPLVEEDNENEEGKLDAPKPPPAPRGRHVSIASIIAEQTAIVAGAGGKGRYADLHLSQISRPRERDPHAFYHHDGRPNWQSRHWRLDCAEFRHQVDAKTIAIRLAPEVEQLQEVRGSINLTATARNLPRPATLVVPVTIASMNGDVEAYARRKVRVIGLR